MSRAKVIIEWECELECDSECSSCPSGLTPSTCEPWDLAILEKEERYSSLDNAILSHMTIKEWYDE